MFFTRAGLEQASRPEVADHHANRFVQAGVRRVIDIGCGIGSDSMAFARAGLEVLAVDVDPVTAVVAQANLADRANVICADANEWPTSCGSRTSGSSATPPAVTIGGALWRVEDFAPPWSFVTHLLDGEPSGRREARPGSAALADSRGGRGGMDYPPRRHRRG